jgi:hypothetical protein
VTVDPTGDNVRWRAAAPAGCRFLSTAAGSSGVAVLQRCADAQVAQLRLFDGFTGSPHWSRDVPLTGDADPRLLGAGPLTTLLVDGEVQGFAPTDGTVLARLPVSGPADDVQAGAADALTLVRADGRLTALDGTGASVWAVPALGMPSSGETAGKDASRLTDLLVPDDGAFVRRDRATGAELGRSAVSDPPAGGIAESVGPDVVLRLPGRLLAYR